MLPEIVLICDDSIFDNYIEELRKYGKVFCRTSVEGETLYSIREGMIYFDNAGNKQCNYRDNFDAFLSKVAEFYSKLPPIDKNALIKYNALKAEREKPQVKAKKKI